MIDPDSFQLGGNHEEAPTSADGDRPRLSRLALLLQRTGLIRFNGRGGPVPFRLAKKLNQQIR